ncbi:MAG: ligase-associated DNA damage response endonuclease PdeM [Pseudomonadota bacterium]
MNGLVFDFHQEKLLALGTGALWWARTKTLIVADLHLGKSNRIVRQSGTLLPPYETQDTLARLDGDIRAHDPAHVICLGDSFDDPTGAETIDDQTALWLTRLQAGRRWSWVEGNHDPGNLGLGGSYRTDLKIDELCFRHIAEAAASGEISGHFHPKARLPTRGRLVSRSCFLLNADRLIMPAYGTYTGGLCSSAPVLDALMGPKAEAILTGPRLFRIPMPR